MRKAATVIVTASVITILAMFVWGIRPSTALADELKITGSTTFAPLIKAVSDPFSAKHPESKISFTQSNVIESINAVIEGKADIGCAARYLSSSESERALSKGLRLTCVAMAADCILPIVHPSNPVKNVGLLQVNSIFQGQITNWKELFGGQDAPIKVISREPEAAMFEFWREKVMRGDSITPNATVLRSNAEIVQMVANNPSAIGYTSFSYLNSQVRPLQLNGIIDVSSESISNHPLSRKLLICVREASSPTVQEFMTFINGAEGKALMQKAGYIPF